MSQDPIDSVNTGQIKPTGETGEPTRSSPDGKAFQKEMETSSTPMQGSQAAQGPSPMEVNQEALPTQKPTIDSLLAQTNDVNTSMQGIQNDLKNNPNLKFKKSQEYLMKNKLADAQEHIQSAGNKIGAQMPEPRPISAGANPVQRFIGMIEDGQNQMASAQQHLQQIQADGGQINPADMMLIQVKLSQAQQEFNFTSILLGKVTESLKTWMNIQI